MRTTVTWSLPAGMRSAVDAEAARRGVPPSKVVEDLIRHYLPRLVSEALEAAFAERRAGVPMDGGPPT